MSGKSSIRVSRKDRIFYAIVNFILLLVLLAVVLPLMNVISSSVSDVKQVMQGKVFLLPKHFSLDGYKAVFQSDSIITGYANTIFYTVAGTALNVVVTLMCAYPLSRKDLKVKTFLCFSLPLQCFFPEE